MINQKIADILYQIANLLEMQEVQFKPRAYRRAAISIESMGENIKEIYMKDKLEKIPGVGKSIAEKIEEIIKTGKCKYLISLKKDFPVDVEKLMAVEGIGPKTIKKLYKKYKIKNIKDLEIAIKKGKLKKLEGFKEKSEKKIIEGIKYAKKKGGRFVLGYIMHDAEDLYFELKKNKNIKQLQVGGSIRRKKDTIGDIDILATSNNPKQVMDYFTKLNFVKKIISKGSTKTSVKLTNGCNVDLRIVKPESFGAALQYFTGNKAHNIELRNIAKKKGWKLNEYGIFKNNKLLAGKTEEEVYKKLGLQWIPPEMRQHTGEIDAAKKNKIPKLVEIKDVHADFQMHTNQSDGANTLHEMVAQAAKLKHRAIAITDHAGSLKIAGALDNKQLLKQAQVIKKIRGRVKVFAGAEVNIDKNGNLDVPDEILKKLDVILGSIHSGFRMSESAMTKRILKSLDNKHMNILAHPTGRLISKRQGFSFDYDKVFQKAKDRGIAVEINAFPERMDLNGDLVRKAVEIGCKLSIGTDAHNINQLQYYPLGVFMARRGWAKKSNIINTFTVEKLKKFFRK